MSIEPSSLSASGAACPAPFSQYDRVVLGHGSGGRLSHDLVDRLLLPALGCLSNEPLEDQAILEAMPGLPAITTDSFVVSPLFFPGGDIGRLAVFGTVNDLAVGGALPRYLAIAFILEEGLPLTVLTRVAESVRAACQEAHVRIVTGDTKVVGRGKADGLFITTTGIGYVPPSRKLSITLARPGDRVIVSGTIGDHGIAVLAERESIALETKLLSDTAPVTRLVESVLEIGSGIRCFRDPTRGGVSSSLNEIAQASRVGMRLEETALPLRSEVRGACELLGFDPLYVACEGRVVAVVAAEIAERVVSAMRAHDLGRDAAAIGTVVSDHPGVVTVRSCVGGERTLSMLSGEQLPRIC